MVIRYASLSSATTAHHPRLTGKIAADFEPTGPVSRGRMKHERDTEDFTFEDMLANRYQLDQIHDALEAMRAFREVKPVVVP